jgi:hypothetical protein
MERDFFDPPWERTNVVLIDSKTLGKVELKLRSCEACNPEEAQWPLDHLLDLLTGHDPNVTDYLLRQAAHCPRCMAEIREKTLVDWWDGDNSDHLENEPALRGGM